MIKDLIKEIAYDKITLTQALTRAKLIAYKIENETFKSWISNELDGYTSGNDAPSYRVVEVETVGSVVDSLGRNYEIQIGVAPQTKEQLNIDLYKWHVNEGIASLERMIGKASGDFMYMQLGPEATEFIGQFIQLPHGVTLKHLLKKIGVSMLFDIANKTKQSLLDTLLELDKEFPNLENEFGTMEEKSKANQIITNNIHGNVSNTNFGIGENIKQEQTINQSQVNETISELRKLGVDNDDIQDLEEIIQSKQSDKKPIHKKLMQWAGNVAKKSVEKGIELQIPEIIERLQSLM
jgi:hypothetical protein